MAEPDSISQARLLDAADPLARFRDEFHLPVDESGKPLVYLVGNSLGLQPRQTAAFVGEELERWKSLGVRGHFTGQHPWMPYHEFLAGPMARIVGALEQEVVMMNSLTANLHLMMATFFRPAGKRRKLMIEGQAFPSDHFAAESQLRWHGLVPEQDLVILRPEAGSATFRMDQVADRIAELRDELALVLLPGVQYYTGQVFDIPRLTRVAREHGIPIGFDLAHAAGNIPLQLHDWGPDFAVWCSYKYLNSGPGSVGGCFVHQRHHANQELIRLAGWWGDDKSTRFLMQNRFRPIPTAEGWQLSNPPILSLAAIRASLELFDRAGGMQPLVDKSRAMGEFFARQIGTRLDGRIEILTPEPRGCQLSLRVCAGTTGKAVKQALDRAGFETDWREPDVIRTAPVPLYNQFQDVGRLVSELDGILAGAVP